MADSPVARPGVHDDDNLIGAPVRVDPSEPSRAPPELPGFRPPGAAAPVEEVVGTVDAFYKGNEWAMFSYFHLRSTSLEQFRIWC